MIRKARKSGIHSPYLIYYRPKTRKRDQLKEKHTQIRRLLTIYLSGGLKALTDDDFIQAEADPTLNMLRK